MSRRSKFRDWIWPRDAEKSDGVPEPINDTGTPRDETLADYPRARNRQVREIREGIKVLHGHHRQREVEQRILDIENLPKNGLKMMRMQSQGGRIDFAEYMYKGLFLSYLYLDKDYEDATFLHPEPLREVLPVKDRPEGTVLLRVLTDGTPQLLHRWEEEKEGGEE